ncbi:MAG: 50S ribosomal protein L29 [Proteobacteria bacterium]|jgi:large subunit ribosomal protein L29|nr:50S ribosomal protein L29 [Pseudomonadota bacterium]
MEKKFRKEVIENFRSLKIEELKTQTQKMKEELKTLQFKMKSGQADQVSNLRRLKKNIARVETVIQEKQGQ